jgi:hypothetical protein
MESVPEDQLAQCDIYFMMSNPQIREPYILKLFGYETDGHEGIIDFDGRNTIKEEGLPIKLLMLVTIKDRTGFTKENSNSIFYNLNKQDELFIEIYKKEIICCTDRISTIEDEDGEEMNVCFTPTDRQKLYFRVKGDSRDEMAKNWFFEDKSSSN